MAPIVLIILTAVTLWLHRRERDTNDELMPAGLGYTCITAESG